MSKRTDAHQRALNDLTTTAPLLAAAIQRLMDSRPALPGASQGGSGASSGPSDPTGNLGLRLAEHNPTDAEIRQLDRTLRRLEGDAAWLDAFTRRWTPRTPNDRDRREVERTNTEDTMCEHCTPHLPPRSIYRERGDVTAEPTDVLGNLDRPMMLGRWCYDWTRKTGRLPTRQMLANRADGRRVMVRA